jgi:hypothetical protein
MAMTPNLRKIALTAHIVLSVGWLGAIAPYLALAVTGLSSHNDQLIRAAYLSMEMIGWYVIVPLSLAALLSGLVQSLGTSWGLFRHWWILVKFGLTVAATVVLLMHMQTVSYMARIASESAVTLGDYNSLRIQLVLHAGGGLLVLLVITALSVFKPWGLTAYGKRRVPQMDSPRTGNIDRAVREPGFSIIKLRWRRVVGIHAIFLVVLFVVLHLAGGGMHHH